ncbi:hypothetical protein [Peribacillus sp. NPDC097225]|uniref:hypothetical protein n=1 Tax=Peribacillus sp. NPDC097225 TaxID=3364400 RepID=UPI0037F96BAE
MDQNAKVVQELKELKQKVASLEDLLITGRKEKAGPGRTFMDAILPLLFGLFVVGPVAVVVIGVLMIVISWVGKRF